MKRNKFPKKNTQQQSPRITELILIKHRNALGQTSPALEAGLSRLGRRPKHKLIRLKSPDGMIEAHHFYGGKLHFLWSPRISLRSLIPHAIELGFDLVLNWDFGYEISSDSSPENSKRKSLRERSIDRSV